MSKALSLAGLLFELYGDVDLPVSFEKALGDVVSMRQKLYMTWIQWEVWKDSDGLGYLCYFHQVKTRIWSVRHFETRFPGVSPLVFNWKGFDQSFDGKLTILWYVDYLKYILGLWGEDNFQHPVYERMWCFICLLKRLIRSYDTDPYLCDVNHFVIISTLSEVPVGLTLQDDLDGKWMVDAGVDPSSFPYPPSDWIKLL